MIARWLSMDPADEFHSPYIYVGNDPVNLIDPDGAQAISTSNGVSDDGSVQFSLDFLGDNGTFYPSYVGLTSIQLTQINNQINNEFATRWGNPKDIHYAPAIAELFKNKIYVALVNNFPDGIQGIQDNGKVIIRYELMIKGQLSIYPNVSSEEVVFHEVVHSHLFGNEFEAYAADFAAFYSSYEEIKSHQYDFYHNRTDAFNKFVKDNSIKITSEKAFINAFRQYGSKLIGRK